MLFGLLLLVLGAVGLAMQFPQAAAALPAGLVTDGLLLGVFGTGLVLGVVHVLVGLLGIVLARYRGAGALFNKLGLVILLVVFLAGSVAVLAGLPGVNWATNGLHLLLAVVVGAAGFGIGEPRPR